MTEISCRAFSYFRVAEQRGLLDVDAILDGLPVTRAELDDAGRRVAWDLWAEMCDRAAVQLGNDPIRLADSGAVVADTGDRGYVGFLGPVASLFATTAEMFDVVARWAGPALYRCMVFGLSHLPDGRLRLSIRLKPGYRPCQAWFQMVPGSLQVLPRLTGQPDARVEVELITPTSGTYLLSATRDRTIRARFRRTLAALRSSRAVSDELGFQQQQLAATIDALRRTEGGFRAAFDELPAYLALHRAGRLVYVNPALAAALGRPALDLVDSPLVELIHPDDRARFERELPAAAASGHDRISVRLAGPGPTARVIEAAALTPFDFGGERTAGLFAVDVTAQREADRQLAISERMASIGTLAAGVAHEINNPLTYVMVGHDQLDTELAALEQGQPVDVPALRALLAEIRDGTGRVRDIVASLRAFSRIEPGGAASRFDPVEAVRRALAMCATELRHRGEVTLALAPTPAVLGEPSRLIQVVVNLLVNAAHALADGQPGAHRIWVTTGTTEDGRVRIEVRDSGIGIPGPQLARIFDPFFTTKPPGDGTGLGLTISHRIVHDLGGDIAVTSEVGQGSAFVVTLPPAPAEPSAPAAVAVAPGVGPGRILIVDDEPLVATALARRLRREGHDVATVSSAAAARAALADRAVDLVLCDLMMPGGSGIDLHDQVAAEDPALAARFVFMTGGAFTDAARAQVERCTRPVLAKPLDLATVLDHLAAILRRSRA